MALGSGQPVGQKHKEEDQAKEDEKADGLPVSHQAGDPDKAALHQVEEPAAGEEDHHREVDGHQKQKGEEDADHDLADAPIGGALIDVGHDVHKSPEGGRSRKENHGEAGKEHGV